MSKPQPSALYFELKLRQCRLGTPLEHPEDFERILFIAHQINNALTIEFLCAAIQVPSKAVSRAKIAKRLFNSS